MKTQGHSAGRSTNLAAMVCLALWVVGSLAQAEVIEQNWDLQMGAAYVALPLPTLRVGYHLNDNWGLEASTHLLGISAGVRYFVSPEGNSSFHFGAGGGAAFLTYTAYANVGWRVDVGRRTFFDFRAGGAKLLGTPDDDDWDARATLGYVSIEIGWKLGDLH